MKAMEKKKLENALRSHYLQERQAAPPSARRREAVVRTAVSAAARAAAHDAGAAGLMRMAARFSPRAFWAVLAVVAALPCALTLSGASAYEAEAALVASGPVLVAACLAGVVRARSSLMQELEASCLNNAVALACARLAVLGGATLLALALACLACSAVVPLGTAAAYALAPYIVSASGGLMLARKVASGDATAAVVAWSAGVCALCVLLRFTFPSVFGDAVVWIWAAVSALGALWLACEVRGWLRLCAKGGVVLEKPVRVGLL